MKEDPRVREMKLWAWVGEDELEPLGKGKMGLKQGVVPAGTIPLVACEQGKIDREFVVRQMGKMADVHGRPRYLVRFVFEAVELIVE